MDWWDTIGREEARMGPDPRLTDAEGYDRHATTASTRPPTRPGCRGLLARTFASQGWARDGRMALVVGCAGAAGGGGSSDLRNIERKTGRRNEVTFVEMLRSRW